MADDYEGPLNENDRRAQFPDLYLDDERPFRAAIIWGESPEHEAEPTIYQFATDEELRAFYLGVDAASGWLDYYSCEIGERWCVTCGKPSIGTREDESCTECGEEEEEE